MELERPTGVVKEGTSLETLNEATGFCLSMMGFPMCTRIPNTPNRRHLTSIISSDAEPWRAHQSSYILKMSENACQNHVPWRDKTLTHLGYSPPS